MLNHALGVGFGSNTFRFRLVDLRGGLSQVGSLAGAAHLLNHNAGVLRLTQGEQKSHVD